MCIMRSTLGKCWSPWPPARSLGTAGAVVDLKDLPVHLRTDAIKIAQGSGAANVSSGFLACGSPGEVANAPMLGHNFRAFQYISLGKSAENKADENYDCNNFYRQQGSTHKQAIWATLALHGRDQLRQRMAWALSQIFVVAVNDASEDMANERSLAFYDIFVRSAFGNFRYHCGTLSRWQACTNCTETALSSCAKASIVQ